MRTFTKIILLTILGSFFFSSSIAQVCSPNPIFTSPGIFPATLPNGCADEPYAQVVTVNVPVDTMLVVPPFPIPITVPIDSIVVVATIGIPPGLSFTCNPASCGFPGGTAGCLLVSGIPFAPGIYSVDVVVNAYANVAGSPVNLLDTISSLYTIQIYSSPDVTVDSTLDASCGVSNGFVSTTIANGTPPYSYSWNTGATTTSISGVPAGVYSVNVTDGNGCVSSTSATLVSAGGPSISLNSASSTLDVDCNGGSNGSIALNISGGTQPFTFSWSNGSNMQDLNFVGAGTYMVTLTDGNGCTSTFSETITEPSPISISTLTQMNPSCNGSADGMITLDIMGGTAPYTVSWNTGQSGPSISGLMNGAYLATVLDANGCTENITIQLTDPDALVFFIPFTTPASCNGGANGAIDFELGGGVSPYTYLWSNGATTQDNTGLSAGTYTVIATDANGCSVTDSSDVTEPPALSVTLTLTDESVAGANDGSASISVTGGTPTYSYSWSNGGVINMISNLSPGNYTVTTTDLNGCSQIDTFTINAGVVGIEDDLAIGIQHFEILPNPNDGNFLLSIEFATHVNPEINIVDLQGQNVWVDYGNNIQKYDQELQLNDLSAGIYLIKIKTEKGLSTRKLVLY